MGLQSCLRFVVVVGLVGWARPGWAEDQGQIPEELAAVISQLEARADQVHSLEMATKRVKRSPTEDETSIKRTWLQRDGDTVLMRTEGRSRITEKWMNPHQRALTTELMVLDGQYKWVQFEVYGDVQVTKEKPRLEAPLAGLHTACASGRARLLPDEEFLDEPCVVIEVRYGEPEKETTVTFWIAKKYGTVLKTVQVDPDGGRTEMYALSLKLDVPIDESKFRYVPPEGVRVRDLDAERARLVEKAREAASQPSGD
jgi:outer membrane lipoprotein-sorting protein